MKQYIKITMIAVMIFMFIISTISVSATLINPNWTATGTETGNNQLNGIVIIMNATRTLTNVTVLSGSTTTRIVLHNGTSIQASASINSTTLTATFLDNPVLESGKIYYIGADANGSNKNSKVIGSLTFPKVFQPDLNIVKGAYFSGGVWVNLTNQAYDIAYFYVSNLSTTSIYTGAIVYPTNNSVEVITQANNTVYVTFNVTKDNATLTPINFTTSIIYNGSTIYNLTIHQSTIQNYTPTLNNLTEMPVNSEDTLSCYDNDTQSLFAWSGHTVSGYTMNDMFRYNYTTGQWMNVSISGKPQGVGGYAFYDPKAKKCLILLRYPYEEEWYFNTTSYAWTNLTDRSIPRLTANADFKQLCYDKNDLLFEFGNNYGTNSGQATELWTYNITGHYWTNVTSQEGSARPSARLYYGFATLPDRCILIGGGTDAGSTYYNDTWMFNYTTYNWTQLTITYDTLFTNRSMMYATYYPDKNSVVMMGGRLTAVTNATNSRQIWECSYTTNACSLKPLQLSDGMVEFSTVYDARQHKILSFGGWIDTNIFSRKVYAYNYSDGIVNDTYLLNGIYYVNYTNPLSTNGTYSLNISVTDYYVPVTVNMTSMNSISYSNSSTILYTISNSQIPSDINSSTINLTVTSTVNVDPLNTVVPNSSFAYIYYSMNTTLNGGCSIIYDGICIQSSAYIQKSMSKINNLLFNATFNDDSILPGYYPSNYTIMESTAGAYVQVYNNNDLRFYIFNMTNSTFHDIEFDAYNLSSQGMTIFYCNNSYTTGNPALSGNCQLVDVFTPEPYSHNYTITRQHIIPIKINITITQNSSFIFVSQSTVGNGWMFRYINDSTYDNRSFNIGNYNLWQSTSRVYDMHMHQFEPTDSFRYYTYFNADNITATSSTTIDFYNITHYPPSAPLIVTPVCGQEYTMPINANINIFYSWNHSSSINNLPITYSVVNNGLISDTIVNGTANNYYNYTVNDTTLVMGLYTWDIIACDNGGLCDVAHSDCTYHICQNDWIQNINPCIGGSTIINYYDSNYCNQAFDVPANNGTTMNCTSVSEVNNTIKFETWFITYIIGILLIIGGITLALSFRIKFLLFISFIGTALLMLTTIFDSTFMIDHLYKMFLIGVYIVMMALFFIFAIFG